MSATYEADSEKKVYEHNCYEIHPEKKVYEHNSYKADPEVMDSYLMKKLKTDETY